MLVATINYLIVHLFVSILDKLKLFWILSFVNVQPSEDSNTGENRQEDDEGQCEQHHRVVNVDPGLLLVLSMGDASNTGDIS